MFIRNHGERMQMFMMSDFVGQFYSKRSAVLSGITSFIYFWFWKLLQFIIGGQVISVIFGISSFTAACIMGGRSTRLPPLGRVPFSSLYRSYPIYSAHYYACFNNCLWRSKYTRMVDTVFIVFTSQVPPLARGSELRSSEDSLPYNSPLSSAQLWIWRISRNRYFSRSLSRIIWSPSC